MGSDRAVLVAVAHLVAVAQGHAFRGEEAAQERAHIEDLMADQLEQPADLPLGHRAQTQARHVDQGAQVGGHHQVRASRVGEDEASILTGNTGGDEVPIEVHRAVDLVFVALAEVRFGLGQCARQHRRGALERDVALALLVECHAGPMADELVAQGPGHTADPEREDDVLDRAAVP